MAISQLCGGKIGGGEFDTAGSFIQGAYSITHENPEKRLIAPMINPIVRNPKRSPFFNNRFTRNIEIEVI